MNEIINLINRISTPGGQTSEGKSMKFGVALMAIVIIMGLIELFLGRNPVTALVTIFTGSGGATWLIRAFSIARLSLKTDLAGMLQNPEFAQLIKDVIFTSDAATKSAIQAAKAAPQSNFTITPPPPPSQYKVLVTMPDGSTQEFPANSRIEACGIADSLKGKPEFENAKIHVL